MPSSAQTIAASGMVNGNGTAPSQDMNAEFSKNNSKPIITIFNQIYGTAPNTASNVAGLHDTILKLPKWATGRDSTGWKSVSAQASASASAIVGTPGDPAATRSLAATIGQSASYDFEASAGGFANYFWVGRAPAIISSSNGSTKINIDNVNQVTLNRGFYDISVTLGAVDWANLSQSLYYRAYVDGAAEFASSAYLSATGSAATFGNNNLSFGIVQVTSDSSRVGVIVTSATQYIGTGKDPYGVNRTGWNLKIVEL